MGPIPTPWPISEPKPPGDDRDACGMDDDVDDDDNDDDRDSD